MAPASLVALEVVVSLEAAVDSLLAAPQAASESVMAAAIETDRIFFMLYSPFDGKDRRQKGGQAPRAPPVCTQYKTSRAFFQWPGMRKDITKA